MTSVFSWQNSISLCPASFCTPRPNLPVTPGVSWLPTFPFQSPIMKRTSFLGVSSKRSFSLHWTIQLQLLQRYWLGHRLGLLWSEWFSLEMNRDHSVVFQIAPKYCILDSLIDYDSYSISSKGFLPTVVDMMVIWVKFIHLQPIFVQWFLKCQRSLLITSNLPWFMDLTFQVPMQYFSLQH